METHISTLSLIVTSLLLIPDLPGQYCPVSGANQDVPTVNLPNGILSGTYLTSRNGIQYEAYRGIHFGNVAARFENSVMDNSTWEGVRAATEYGPVCAQPSSYLDGASEDCLYLNVFTPKADDKKRPVIVYIHGGGFTTGASTPQRAKYFMDEDVILVTITYRVGIMGFLSIGDGLVTGNMGLRDQVIALKWIQQNIEAFGGDPDLVTITGTSAGGASVNFLLLSPLAKGLFHRAVAFSGAATNPWAFRENTQANTVAIGEKLSCNTTNSDELVACLRGVTLNQLFDAQNALTKWFTDPIAPFSPTLEIRNELNPEPFLDRTPIDILQSGDFNRVPVILTVNKDEGIILNAAVVLRNESLRQELNDDWDRVAPITFLYDDVPGFSEHIAEISNEIRQFYFGNADITLENEHNLTNLYTDSWFLKGIHDTALHLAKHVPVFTGLYTHQRKDYSIAIVFGITELLGVSHGDEVLQLFNFYENGEPEETPLMKDVVETDDLEISNAFVKIVTSFATSGTPEILLGNSSTSWNPVSEFEVETGELNWFNLRLDPSLLINPFKSRMGFWDSIYKKQDGALVENAH